MMRHTVTALAPAIGATVAVRMQDLTIDCQVIDAKNSWGKVRLLVQPVAGRGEQWVELERLVWEMRLLCREMRDDAHARR